MPNKYQKVNSDQVEPTSSDNRSTMAQVVSNIPSTHSSQQLMQADTDSVNYSASDAEDQEQQKALNRETNSESFGSVSSKEWFTVGVLCFINLINYMDRFTIAGELIRSLFLLKKYLLL